MIQTIRFPGSQAQQLDSSHSKPTGACALASSFRVLRVILAVAALTAPASALALLKVPLAFEGPLMLDLDDPEIFLISGSHEEPDEIYLIAGNGESDGVEIIARVRAENLCAAKIEIVRVDSGTHVCDIEDDRHAPDGLPGDGVYSGLFDFSEDEPGEYCYQAQGVDSLGNTIVSAPACLWVAPNREQRFQAIFENLMVQALAERGFIERRALGDSVADAAAYVREILEADERVSAHSVGHDENGVWWMTTDFVFGEYTPPPETTRQ